MLWESGYVMAVNMHSVFKGEDHLSSRSAVVYVARQNKPSRKSRALLLSVELIF